jgi:choline dehydrogenase
MFGVNFIILVLWGCAFQSVTCLLLEGRDAAAQMYPTYDYIIVGGGVSGLVIANRLTEDSSSTCNIHQIKYEC